MLLILTINQGVEQTGLNTEMQWQLERERSTHPDAVQVHVRERDTMCPLPMLGKTSLDTIFHTKLISLLALLFAARIEEGIVLYLQPRLRLVIRPHNSHAQA